MFSTLDRKLFRDLNRMKLQAMAIAVVMALGVMILVMMGGLVISLEQTRDTYYERYRLAHVFGPVARAPRHVIARLAAIDGVNAAIGRINGSALINMPSSEIPIQAQIVSLPNFEKPKINDVYLVDGRAINSAQEDEILIIESFAKAHNLSPGDTISATINGAKRNLRIAGLAQSPEFLYTAVPGELAPDDKRFAIIWMKQKSLEAAFDLKGAFNEALLLISREANLTDILAKTDRILDSFGGFGAYGIVDHSSNRFIAEEIKGVKASGKAMPPIFLGIAAFLLYIVIARIIQSERQQIGLLKAFGYTSFEIGLHYMKFIMVIAVGGAILGSIWGIMAGRSFASIYQIYYKFPFLVFQIDPATIIVGLIISVITATLGGVFVLRGIFKLSPAVAMRAATPPDFNRSKKFGIFLKKLLDQPTRMIIRTLMRQPGRAAGAVIAIAAGMSLTVAMIGIMASFDDTIEISFGVIDRSDVTVSFVAPLSSKTIFELQSIDGVQIVEPIRNVPVILQNGLYTHKGAVSGLLTNPELNRAVDHDYKPMSIRDDGIIIASAIAKKLHIKAGDFLTVNVREGIKPVLHIPVVGITETLIGSPIYMQLDKLNTALKQPNRVSGAFLKIDSAKQAAIYKTLKNMSQVAGVSLASEAKQAFQTIMDSGAGAMRFVMAAVAFVITFGIVFNSAKIAFAERERDLACIRTIGFSKGETAYVLLGELGLITLIALPIGSVLGYYLSFAAAQAFSTDLYKIPTNIVPEAFGTAALAVIVAAIFSGWLVKRNIDNIDLVAALKTQD